ncbi:hypothetical protein [Wenjunlia tyrosinilytica]|uniref:Uncharacterized protein n=1 Tax=Wenjunlia tyrosinilytica TaxID=1544741 RepID=A0A917ZVN6_9ACTN|nr:hypothetical protein [Wenjunlia tyrosinilytica]GGO94395.1 hypothetical protein GCM10012280_49120 [Wenjunlia tyrosinilytica]
MSSEHRAEGILARPTGTHRRPRRSRPPRLRLALTAGAALTVLGGGTAFADDTEGAAAGTIGTESTGMESLATESLTTGTPTQEQLQAALDQLKRAAGRSVWEAARE